MGTILRVLSLKMFKKTPIFEVFLRTEARMREAQNQNSLSLFD